MVKIRQNTDLWQLLSIRDGRVWLAEIRTLKHNDCCSKGLGIGARHGRVIQVCVPTARVDSCQNRFLPGSHDHNLPLWFSVSSCVSEKSEG